MRKAIIARAAIRITYDDDTRAFSKFSTLFPLLLSDNNYLKE
jgi:hypothetical protein